MDVALVLTGGGARAAYQVGVLAAVKDILSDQSAGPFPIICGTSAGAINSLALAAHPGNFTEAVTDLQGIWSQLQVDRVIKSSWLDLGKGVGRIASAFFNQGVGKGKPISLLDNSPLRQLLAENIQFENIQAAIDSGRLNAVSVTAMAYSSGESISFFQGHDDIAPWKNFHRKGVKAALGLQHLMASSAIPGIFPTVKIGNEYYGDGAVRQLSPLSTAIELGADKIFVIGVSNNRNPKHWGERHTVVKHSPSLGQVVGHLLNSAFVDSLEGDLEHLEKFNRLVAKLPKSASGENQRHREIQSLVISPSKPLDKLAGQSVRYLPKPFRVFMRSSGATASGGGANLASYLLFTEQFCNKLIDLGYQDAMWERDAILRFFDPDLDQIVHSSAK